MALQVAMSPPMPFGGRVLVVSLGVVLASALTCRLSRRSPTFLGKVLAGVVVVVTLVLGVLWDDGLGVGAFLGGAVAGNLLFCSSGQQGQQRERHAGWLIAACLCIGPMLGACCWGLALLVVDIPLLDRSYYLVVCLIVGSISGLLGAAVVAIATRVPRP